MNTTRGKKNPEKSTTPKERDVPTGLRATTLAQSHYHAPQHSPNIFTISTTALRRRYCAKVELHPFLELLLSCMVCVEENKKKCL
jgi:hypothetical protein